MKIQKVTGFFTMLLLAAATAATAQQSLAYAGNSRQQTGYGKLPLLFQANRGQTDSSVRFVSRGHGYSLFLTGDEAILSLKNQAATGSASASPPAGIRMKLLTANPAVKIDGAEEVDGPVVHDPLAFGPAG